MKNYKNPMYPWTELVSKKQCEKILKFCENNSGTSFDAPSTNAEMLKIMLDHYKATKKELDYYGGKIR